MKSERRWGPWGVAFLSVGLLAGCGADLEGLQEELQAMRREVKPNVSPLSAPKVFAPEPYHAESRVEPFNVDKLALAGGVSGSPDTAVNPLLARELNRRKEPLEEFPLDAVRYVGSLQRGGKPLALVMVDKILYQVRVGDHIGLQNGRVIQITETTMTVREIVPDAAGELIERPQTLELQETAR